MKLQESLDDYCNPETLSTNKATSSLVSPCTSPSSRPLHSFEAKAGNSASSSCGIDSPSKGESHTHTARSQLHEICAINCWKPPLFECCKEEGPSHLRSVIIEIEEALDMILECFSSPRTTKKAAAEHEGALWYLKHEGYLQ
ncbi:ribonuclease 3-like protein 1 [Hibiscus syriacus]|uniref:ribonuclease 3-like protein 1 n=1 Tax=Hibiscus syriacus TaxID=106335 RepID=UPI0019218176|nr:ribonuclease 3-like protein 1 [Hibiscus syriacus]